MRKNLRAMHTDQVIRSKKNCEPCARFKHPCKKIACRTHVSSYPCEKIACRTHGSSYACKKNCLPSTQAKLSVRKKLPSVRIDQVIRSQKNYHLCDRLGLSVPKQFAIRSLRTTCKHSIAIHILIQDLL